MKFADRVTKLVFTISVQLYAIGCMFSEGIVVFNNMKVCCVRVSCLPDVQPVQ